MNILHGTHRTSPAGSRAAVKIVLSAAVASLCGFGAPAWAEDATFPVERTVKSAPNKDTRIGLYINVLPDCTSGPLPTIRLVNPPASGKVTVKSAKVKATNYKACLALEVPAYVAFYRSQPDFVGDDAMTIEVKYPGGRTEIQKITVNVVGTGTQQKI
jgi:hypothetical protein